jgi:hypothetical protein
MRPEPLSPDCDAQPDHEADTRRQRRIGMPYREWPALDRDIWDRSLTANGPLDFGATQARIARPTVEGRRKTYAALLTFLRDHQALDPDISPGDRITPDIIDDYVVHQRFRLRPSSLHEEINRLATVLGVMAPGKDWCWLRRLRSAPTRIEIEQSKKPIDPPDPAIVINAALNYFDESDARPTSTIDSTNARNALIITFAALFALRRLNLQEIERGTHLLEDGSTVRLAFNDSLKNHTALLFDVPEWIMPRLNRYLQVHRALLLGPHKDNGALWVSKRPVLAV